MGLKKQSPVLALVTRPPEFILLLIVSLHKGRGDFYGWDPITRCPRKWAGLISHISDCDLLLLENGRDRDWIWRRTRDPRDRRWGWEVGQGVSFFPDCKFTSNTINSHSRFPHRIVFNLASKLSTDKFCFKLLISLKLVGNFNRLYRLLLRGKAFHLPRK